MEILPSDEEKLNIVIERNTYFFRNPITEEDIESQVTQITQLLLNFQNKLKTKNLSKKLIVDFIREKEDGLTAILALIGLSRESFLRLLTFTRISNDEELIKLINKESWNIDNEQIEWNEEKIIRYIKENRSFSEGIVNLLTEGSTCKILRKVLPLFEFKKLSLGKFKFDLHEMIDTIVRYKMKGSIVAGREMNPERVIENILRENNIEFVKGRLPNIRRLMDFIIPNLQRPKIIIECSFVSTTSSGMGDKARTELGIAEQIRRYYEYATFISFIDGIGWLVRRNDLMRMVNAFDNVFTFDYSEIKRFLRFIKDILGYE
jgi:hypothetical protein